MPKEFLTQSEAADLLHVSVRSLERWRLAGTGPRFHKAGRRVLYLRSEVERWLMENQFSSTSEERAA